MKRGRKRMRVDDRDFVDEPESNSNLNYDDRDEAIVSAEINSIVVASKTVAGYAYALIDYYKQQKTVRFILHLIIQLGINTHPAPNQTNLISGLISKVKKEKSILEKAAYVDKGLGTLEDKLNGCVFYFKY